VATKTATYTGEDISQLKGLEAVRRLPGMYIGDNAAYGLHHILLEVVDNAVDEAMAGVCDRIEVTLYADGSVSVEDNGRGIPVDIKEEKGKSALTLALTELHTGGKFEGSRGGYLSGSGGLHGIGVKATNGYSEWLEVRVKRDGVVYYQRFEGGGEPVTDVEIRNPRTDKVIGALGQRDLTKKAIKEASDPTVGTGTTITFRPNREWFSASMEWQKPEKSVPWDANRLSTRFQQMAALNPSLTIVFHDLRGKKTASREFHYPKGLIDYLAFLTDQHQRLFDPPIYFKDEGGNNGGTIVVEVAMQYTDSDQTQIYAFVNSIFTPHGGTGVSGFQAGLTKALNQFAQGLKDKDLKSSTIRGEDALLGLTAIVNVRMSETPTFSSQTKDSLTSPEVQGVAMSITYDHLLTMFGKKTGVGRTIVRQCVAAQKGREAAKQARKLVMRRSALDAPEAGILGKLADVAKGTPTDQTMLYIVEGDSAGGSCKQARDRRHHAILPLRGKVLNTYTPKINRVLSNGEIKALIAAIGAGVGPDFQLKEMRYGGVAILTDADHDGHHIKTLLLTFFWKYMRPLVEAGRMYIAEAPLYLIREKGGRQRSIYVYNDEEYDRMVKSMGGIGKVVVQRYKGLGEMNPGQLKETIFALDPGGDNPVLNDRLVQFEVDDVHFLNTAMGVLMGNQPGRRKRWLFTRWEQGAETADAFDAVDENGNGDLVEEGDEE
jgi:DNA gyrase subunit B